MGVKVEIHTESTTMPVNVGAHGNQSLVTGSWEPPNKSEETKLRSLASTVSELSHFEPSLQSWKILLGEFHPLCVSHRAFKSLVWRTRSSGKSWLIIVIPFSTYIVFGCVCKALGGGKGMGRWWWW